MHRRASVLLFGLLLILASCSFDSGPRDLSVLPGGAAAAPSEAPKPTPRGPRGGPVLALGDSLLVGAVEHGGLGDLLVADGWGLQTVAERGRSAAWAVSRVEEERRVPRTVVLVLGSNPGFSAAGFADDVLTLLAELEARGARRIIWIPPHHPDPERYAEKRRVLDEADRIDGRLTVPNWGAILDANPWWVSGDGIHLSENGYTALAAFIRDQLARVG